MKKILFFIFITALFVSNSYADHRPEFSLILKDARRGDIEAMCDLGVAYFHGYQTLKDPFKAKCWIKKAYNQGSVRAEKLWEDLKLWQYSGKCEALFDDEAIPKYSEAEEYREPFTGMEFIFIPGGCFIMGCHELAEKCDKDEMPAHRVCIKGFWIGKYEVTQKTWYKIMGRNPSMYSTGLRRPVENISFNEILEFIQILNLKTREKFSLPTEAQWEYACRNGGELVNFSWGSEDYRPRENCGTCDSGSFYGTTAPVGSFPPNELGLFDMAGNVKEWCRDVYDKKAYAEHGRKNPYYGKKGFSRVVRGGSFADNTSKLRCTSRDKYIPGLKSSYIGFRMILERDY